MKKRKFVAESLEDFYGKGYKSTFTREEDEEKTDSTLIPAEDEELEVPRTRAEQHERTSNWWRPEFPGDTPADQGIRAARKEEAPERKDPDAAFYKGGYGEKRARPGFKQYHVLKALSEAPDGLRYSDIIKIAYELSHGEGTFDPKEHRGYWSAPFVSIRGVQRICHHPPEGWMMKYADYLDKRYHINDHGLEKLEQLSQKWE